MKTRTLPTFAVLAVLTCVLFSAAHVLAARKTAGFEDHARTLGFSKTVPSQLNYQGYLVDAADSSAVTGTLEMTFRLYDSQTKGAELWSETHPAVEVNNGLFHVLLGSVTLFAGSLFDGSTLWLQTEVGAEVLTPRKPLVSSAYSQKAANADLAATAEVAGDAERLEGQTISNLDDRWVNEEDLDHLDAADGDPVDAVYVDDAGKVGIGTTSPLTELDVNGSVNAITYYGDGSNLTGISGTADADWTINGNDIYHEMGKVGIGTASPTTILTVRDNTTMEYGLRVEKVTTGGNSQAVSALNSAPPADGHGSHGGFFTANASVKGTGNKYGVRGQATGTGGTNYGGRFYASGASKNYGVYVAGGDVYLGSGNVGIGTTTPTAPLTIQTVSGADILFTSSGYNADIISDSEFRIGTSSAHNVHLLTDDTFRLTLTGGEGNVGIGTTSPAAKLDVRGTLNIGVDAAGHDVNFYGAGSKGRLFWDESKMAFRAGQPLGNDWDDAQTGDKSFASGYHTEASGYASTALGNGTTASDSYATAMGFYTTAGSFNTVAMGTFVTASAPYSIVLGSGETEINRLVNNTSHSLMVGFNSTTPILFADSTCVGVGTSNPARTLHVNDVMRLEPRASAPGSPSEGDIYMDSTTHKLMVYDGTTWQACW